MARWIALTMFVVGCGSTVPEGASCSTDAECETGYCECASACRDGCCAKKPDILYDACTADCEDLSCPADG